MRNEFVFQNVNINTISFVNNKNDIKFEFIDSYSNSGKYCGELLCMDFISLNIHTDLDDEPFFPQFVCDVSINCIPEKEELHRIEFHGSTYEITITCKAVTVTSP